MEPLVEGTLVELLTVDTVLIETVTPEWDEKYRPNSGFSVKAPSRSGTYLVRVSNPAYDTIIKKFTIKVGKREDSFSLGMLKLRRLPVRVKDLSEVVVTASKVKFYMRGDTLIYNADAFNLAEGSMLDALIEQLPGAELKRDGRIFVHGKLVESLLLNGKDFFKSDKTVLLDNLPAYTVENVKVYNKRSEISELVGHDIDDGSYVMDVNLKRQYQIGWSGNLEVGGGSEERWLARLFAMRFTPQSRVSFFGNVNNISENRKPGRNGEWSPDDIGNGLYSTKTAGLDYMVDDKRKSFDVSGEFGVSHTDLSMRTQLQTENFLADRHTFSRQWNVKENKNTSINTKHRFRFNIGPENNKNDIQLRVNPNFSYNYNRGWENLLAAEFESDLEGYVGLKDSLLQPTMDAKLVSLYINRVRSKQLSNSHIVEGGATAQFDMKIPYTSDYLGIYTEFNTKHQNSETSDLYMLDNKTSVDYRHRYLNCPIRQTNANIGINYTRPLDSEWIWLVTPQIEYTYRHVSQENSLYRLDRLDDLNNGNVDVLPSTREAMFDALDVVNSYMITQDTHETAFCFNGRWDKEYREDGQRNSRWRFLWNSKLKLLNESFLFEGLNKRHPQRTVLLPSVHVELLRNTPKMKHEIEVVADFSQSLPSMFSMLDMRFDSDPLNIKEGNTDLRRTSVFSFSTRYKANQWLRGRGQSLSSNVTMHFYHNLVAMSYVYDYTSGVRVYRPRNVRGNWDMEANVYFSTSVDKKRRFEFKMNLSNNYRKCVDFIGIGTMNDVSKSVVYTNYLQLPLSLEYSRNKEKIGLKVRAAWNHAESNRMGFSTVNAADILYGIYGHTRVFWGMQITSDITYFTRYGYSDDFMNTHCWVWNVQLSKSVLQNRLTFSFIGFDILKQMSNISYSLDSQARTEKWCNVIPRYIMLKASYRFHKQPQKH